RKTKPHAHKNVGFVSSLSGLRAAFLLLVARGGFALHAAASPAARLVRPAGARCAAGLSVLRRGCRMIVRDMT
ncbi:hypothetical protein, partial [Burkholderia pseudomallei]|uniref:hypothetical protein n=1 Tax=Burkholderia pseudomallei TaxID=28450 RepID=UPI001177A60A